MKRLPAWIQRVFYYMKEEWRSVKGYEGLYEVSNLGRVKSLKRKGCKNDRILRNSVNNYGYYDVALSLNGFGKTKKVHKLVAVAFLNHKPCGHKEVVDHIDNNPLNNNVDNLQLITPRENTSKDRKGGTSKYVGVCWHKRDKKWEARMHVNGSNKYLGSFTTELEASEVYQSELKKLK